MDKKLILIPVVLLLLAIFQAGRYGVASIYAMKPHESLEEWVSHDAKPNKLEIEEELSRLEIAIRFDQEDPSYLEDQARFKIFEANIFHSDRQQYLHQALVSIRKAIEMRPVSPYAWATLLFVKSGLGEIDVEFDRALSNAVFLGPSEPEVQFEVARIGIANWERLDFRQREEVRKDIARAMKLHSEEIIQIVMAGKRAGR